MGPGIPAPNINVWDGSGPEHPQWTAAILPDKSTGGLYNSSTLMQDTQHINSSWADAPIAAPWLPTAFTQVGTTALDNSWG